MWCGFLFDSESRADEAEAAKVGKAETGSWGPNFAAAQEKGRQEEEEGSQKRGVEGVPRRRSSTGSHNPPHRGTNQHHGHQSAALVTA